MTLGPRESATALCWCCASSGLTAFAAADVSGDAPAPTRAGDRGWNLGLVQRCDRVAASGRLGCWQQSGCRNLAARRSSQAGVRHRLAGGMGRHSFPFSRRRSAQRRESARHARFCSPASWVSLACGCGAARNPGRGGYFFWPSSPLARPGHGRQRRHLPAAKRRRRALEIQWANADAALGPLGSRVSGSSRPRLLRCPQQRLLTP